MKANRKILLIYLLLILCSDAFALPDCLFVRVSNNKQIFDYCIQDPNLPAFQCQIIGASGDGFYRLILDTNGYYPRYIQDEFGGHQVSRTTKLGGDGWYTAEANGLCVQVAENEFGWSAFVTSQYNFIQMGYAGYFYSPIDSWPVYNQQVICWCCRTPDVNGVGNFPAAKSGKMELYGFGAEIGDYPFPVRDINELEFVNFTTYARVLNEVDRFESQFVDFRYYVFANPQTIEEVAEFAQKWLTEDYYRLELLEDLDEVIQHWLGYASVEEL